MAILKSVYDVMREYKYGLIIPRASKDDHIIFIFCQCYFKATGYVKAKVAVSFFHKNICLRSL